MTPERIAEIVENVTGSNVNLSKQNNEFELEFSYYSEAGEDCHETIYFDGTPHDFLNSLNEYLDSYEEMAKENALNWVGGPGAPDVFVLVEDAKRKIANFKEWEKQIRNEIVKEVDMEDELWNGLYDSICNFYKSLGHDAEEKFDPVGMASEIRDFVIERFEHDTNIQIVPEETKTQEEQEL